MANSPARAVVDVGTVIDGTYIIEGIIGRGGMGAVFLAKHNRLEGKKVAIKMLHVDVESGDVLKRFKTEADIASKLNHPNIVAVIDYDELEDGTPYIVYEFLQGESLAQRIADGGALDLESVFSIMRQVGSALSAAHRAGVVHRDLKPANIFLVPTEADGRAVEIAKVLDFGISKVIDGSTQAVKTQEAMLLGTPQYMSPEQANGQHSIVDARTDIFALGEILYEMVSGTPAFAGSSIPEVVHKVVYEPPKPLAETAPDVPDPIVSVIMKALEKKPEDRFQNVNDLVEALTGSPLSSTRKPRYSRAASGSPSSQDAFAQTVGSGEHGDSPTAGTAPTAAAVGKSAVTVSSRIGIPTVPSQLEHASTVVPNAATTAPPRRRGLLLLAVIGTVAAGAAVVFFAMHGGHEMPTPTVIAEQPLVQSPVVADAAFVAVDTVAAVAAVDAVAAVAAVVAVVDKKPKLPTENAVKLATLTKTKADDKGDPDVDPLLIEAQALFTAREWNKLIQLTNRILAFNVSTTQAAKARAYHGMAMCGRNGDDEARTDLRAITELHAPAQRARLLKFCHDEHHLEADQ